MHCPFCHNPDSRVVDTRIADDGASIRRRRECTHCKKRFTTLETSSFQVVKRSGVVESFSRNKVVSGVKKACQGRPVSDDQLAILAQQVEEQLRSTGVSNVSTNEVGKAILPFLRDLDVIAYLRFASCTGPSTPSRTSRRPFRRCVNARRRARVHLLSRRRWPRRRRVSLVLAASVLRGRRCSETSSARTPRPAGDSSLLR